MAISIHAIGGQGSGKSTAIGLIDAALRAAGYVTTGADHDGHYLVAHAPLPAPTPVEPPPAPETPDAFATRLLGDPELFADVLKEIASRTSPFERQALHDELQKRVKTGSYQATGLRLIAATIAAGSFGK